MKAGKILKLFKKGAKHAPKGKGQVAAGGGIDWPSGMRIGVYGHANAGKTVYFTVLNEESKISKDLGLSVTDNITAGEFLTNYRALWGLGTSDSAGTMVDLREDKKFPSPTQGDKLLQFNAILDRSKNIPIVTYDYSGKAVSIQEQHELADKVKDFMAGCKGILFFFDPKMLGAELQCQAHVASFVNTIEMLAPAGRRLPIPVALVVTKADVLPGFSGDSHTVLVGGEDEHYLAEDFEVFLEKVLASSKIASNSAWAGSVRDILVKLKEFLKLVVGSTLDFQIFFTSSTGVEPVKIGSDVGRSLYKPPDKMQPVGVREPFHWLLKAIIRNRRLAAFRKLAKYAVVLSLLFAAVWSIPHFYSFHYQLNRITNFEKRRLETSGSIYAIDPRECRAIYDKYRSYQTSWLVANFFLDFQPRANTLYNMYKNVDLEAGQKSLDALFDRMANVVRDESQWPIYSPSNDSIVLTEEISKIDSLLASYLEMPDTISLHKQAARSNNCWSLFKNMAKSPTDSALWNDILKQIEPAERDKLKPMESEKGVYAALREMVSSRQGQVDTRVKRDQTFEEFDSFIAEELDDAEDPEYLLGKAVTKLKPYRNKLAGVAGREEDHAKIGKFLSAARYFDKDREYSFALSTIPSAHHIHIKVEGPGRSGEWQELQQFSRRTPKGKIFWKKGDRIHIALHKIHQQGDEHWGEGSDVLEILKGDFAIFKMTEIISFGATQQQISFESINPDPHEKLPKW